MKLKSFGCSFVYGSDLQDCPHGTDINNPPPSQLSFPALLARERQMEYVCHARPAAGNFQILHSLISNVDAHPAIYLINWTWIDRFSFIKESAKSGSPWNPLGWCSILPTDDDHCARIYFKHLNSQHRDKLETLILIKFGIDWLLQHRQPFIMTYTDDLIFETEWHCSDAIIALQNYIKPYMHTFEEKSFFEWAKQKQFAMSPGLHPLEQCHAAAAKILMPTIDAILHKV